MNNFFLWMIIFIQGNPYLNSCPETLVFNESNEPWNQVDEESLTFNKKRCRMKYYYSPCLKTFTKIAPRSYRAICTRQF